MIQRIQRLRKKGFRSPPKTRYCGRPTKYGNPYQVGMTLWTIPPIFIANNAVAVSLFRSNLERRLALDPDFLKPLLKYDFLSCWCPLDKPCHVDVILEFLAKDTE